MTQEAAATYLNCTRQTIQNHLKRSPDFFSPSIASVRAIKNSLTSGSVAEVVEEAQTRIKRMFDRSFLLSEKLLERAEELGDEASIEQLMEIHKNMTMWAAKFAASEAPKRLKVEGGATIEHIHVMSFAEARNAITAKAEIERIYPKGLLEAPPDA